jgi:primosomal replication protein N
MLNRLHLVASVIEREPVRYTPAGVPIVNCILQHASEVLEAGVKRHVELTLQALAAGEVSTQVAACELGVDAQFAGFLARKSRNARTLVFHITELQDIGKD